jgi:hypothetical protein
MILTIEGNRLIVQQIKLNETTSPKGGDIAFAANVKLFQKTLKNNPQISFVDLRNNKIGDMSIKALIPIFNKFPQIASINLSNNNLSFESAVIISQLLDTHENLIWLDLRWNRLRSKGMLTIASTCMSEPCRSKAGLQIKCEYNGFQEETLKNALLAKNPFINLSQFPLFLEEQNKEEFVPKPEDEDTAEIPSSSSSQSIYTPLNSFSFLLTSFHKIFRSENEYERLQPLNSLNDFSSLPEHQGYGTFGEIPRGTLR